jgi:DNA repair photolyase
VRWDQLLIVPPTSDPADEGERQSTPLPLALPGAVARTFDTPEFRGMTFYEVRAKSIINRVPPASRMMFEWTINPYRGCTHRCVYCLAGETPILMADGRTRPLADLAVGDRIYGTVADGPHRRYVTTEVLAHWRTGRRAYRLRLADGTTLVASADHRFLSDRGWTHAVAGAGLMGVGAFADAPRHGPDYRRGYLYGVIRGDEYAVAPEAAARARSYLASFGVSAASFVDRPPLPSPAWYAGLLAGLFDSRGSCDSDGLRIADSEARFVDAGVRAMRVLGFAADLDRTTRHLRLRGGTATRLRFFHTVDPAVTGKLDLTGAPVESHAGLRVDAVEPLDLVLPMFDITTGTGDFVANGVVSHNCFARKSHTYLDLDAGADFDTRIVVKVNAPELTRRELASPRWRGAHIAMGTNVDCYQRAEGRYRLMPGIIGALRDFANPFSILTKGTLILRDLDLLRSAAEVTRVGLAFSVGFVDEALWRSVEPGTPSPRRRLDAVRRFREAGFDVAVLMAPILPGLTDSDDQIEATVAAIARAGATSITPIALHLRPGAREWYLAWLARERADLLPFYRRLYGRGSYLAADYQKALSARVHDAARRHGIERDRGNRARGSGGSGRAEGAGTPAHTQLTLL